MTDIRPINAAAAVDLARRIKAIEAAIAGLQSTANAVAISSELAGIADAITLLKPCIIENFGVNRMDILDRLAALETELAAAVADNTTAINGHSAQLTQLQNDINTVAAQAHRAGWLYKRYYFSGQCSITSRTATAWPGSTNNASVKIDSGGSNVYRWGISHPAIRMTGITIREARLITTTLASGPAYVTSDPYYIYLDTTSRTPAQINAINPVGLSSTITITADDCISTDPVVYATTLPGSIIELLRDYTYMAHSALPASSSKGVAMIVTDEDNQTTSVDRLYSYIEFWYTED